MKDLKEETIEEVQPENAQTDEEEMETIIIDEEDVEFKDTDEENVLKVDEQVKEKRDFVKEVKDLSEAEDEKVEKILNYDQKIIEKEQFKAVDLLTKFKEYVSGEKFDKKCNTAGKKYGIDGKDIKNKFIKNSLRTIADILNLTVSIAGDIINGVTNFINIIISSITNYTSNALHKLINILTLNCGSVM